MMVTPHCSLQHAARLMTLIATSYGWQLAVGKEQSRVSRGSSVEDTFTPYHPGLLNILGKKMAPWLSRLLRSRSAVTVVGMLETYLAFLQGKGAGSGWDMQAEVGVALAHLSGPNPIIFDVGANDGDWSAQILKALGPNCRIIQFEPSPLCQEILQAQQSAQTVLIDAAVGDRPGTATLYGLDFGSRFASLHPRRDSYLSGLALRQSTVRVVTIDEVMDNLEIAVVDFMKLDIEGNELAALRGARRVLESKRIRALTFEFGSGNINSRTYFRDFWDLLQPLGYTVERIGPSGILIPVSAYYEDLEYFRGVTNYLAVLKGWPQDPSPALADTSRDA